MAVAGLLSIIAFVELLGTEARLYEVTVATWIPPISLETATGIGTFEVPWAFRLDPLSAMMILVVTGIGFLIHVYSNRVHGPRVARRLCPVLLLPQPVLFLHAHARAGQQLLVMFVAGRASASAPIC